jgi:predicted NUDIX family NTP pyrophosphohydrolase
MTGSSTFENGQYKAVNMAGAAAISVVMNALGHREFPFVFGGDGVSFAVPPEARDIAADALARTARWVEEEIDLSLRAAMVPVSDIRASGNDVLVARYGASPAVAYAMFSGPRRRMGGNRDEAGPVRRRSGAARRSPRPDRPVLPMETHRIQPGMHPVDDRRPRGRRDGGGL